jgi:hypothetical protein
VKALALICAFALVTDVVAGSSGELGLLTNYYGDCPARHGRQSAELRSTILSALRGDATAMRLLVMHEGIYSTGDNEGYSEVPQALLRTLGDERYSSFVVRQPAAVQELALNVYPDQISGFERRFPKTAKLYRERFSR